MIRLILKPRAMFLILPLLTSLACSALSGLSPSPQSELTVQEDKSFGSGAFMLSDPRVGLTGLSSYKATLTLSFDGTRAGRSEQWSKKYLMLASLNPAIRQLTIETTGLPNSLPVLMAESEGAEYEVLGKNPCSATATNQANSLNAQLEPAGFLHFVIGAEEAGSATVNNVAVNHFTFNEGALGQQNLTQSTGDLWVAATGGYVVKYVLTTKANADYFGPDTEGTLTWDYELTDVGKPVNIKIPADCPGGTINAPLLPDASGVASAPGVLAYQTSTSLADAAAFYQSRMPALGWKLQGAADITQAKALLDYKQGDQELSVFMTTDSGVTSVNMLLARVQK